MSAPQPRRPFLYDLHDKLGATFTTFAGWQMPLHYGGSGSDRAGGAAAEHHAVRNSTGLFDISHMGRILVRGSNAGRWLASMLSADIARLAVGLSTYALLCRDNGGVIDDVFVYRLSTQEYLVVVNAARRERDIQWFTDHLPEESATALDADGAAGASTDGPTGTSPDGTTEVALTLDDISNTTVMLALQGPMAQAVLKQAGGMFYSGGAVQNHALARLPRFGVTQIGGAGSRAVAGAGPREPATGTPAAAGWIARTGYTGEDGFEIILPTAAATEAWEEIFAAAGAGGVRCLPAGLAARDSLRLEVGFALYGHELTEEISPVEARLLWACDLDHDFIGREAILRRKQDRPRRTLRRLVLQKAGVPREGYRVLSEGEEVGEVVSGGKALSFECFIANAYVDATVAKDTPLSVEIRGKQIPARQNRGPIYRPSYIALDPPARHLDRRDEFGRRHLGVSRAEDEEAMLKTVGAETISELVEQVVPEEVRRHEELSLPEPLTEDQLAARFRSLGSQNTIIRSLIGLGYADTITPPVIRRSILENPKWYTSYTPYQAEISQGRLEALLNFQTMVSDLTGMDIANASMLDEATAGAEAVMMALRQNRRGPKGSPEEAPLVYLSEGLHPQTIAHIRTRGEAAGLQIVVGADDKCDPETMPALAVLVIQYPDTRGRVGDYRGLVARVQEAGGSVVVATDLLSLTLLTPPGEWGADVVVGNSQRFGVPMMFGGPHAAFLATRESWKRRLPGRLVGVSRDSRGRPALRLALQTREQHIRRDKATSNICTAQALLAIIASMYAVYHGPRGLTAIARRVRLLAELFRAGLARIGFSVQPGPIFDTVVFSPPDASGSTPETLVESARRAGFNLRLYPDTSVGASFDERSDLSEVQALLEALSADISPGVGDLQALLEQISPRVPLSLERTSPFLTEKVFSSHHSETELLRYITSLQEKDISLADTMIPLGSCTMKLNPTAALEPVTAPEFASIHPFAPEDQTQGYQELSKTLSSWLCEITEMDGCTLQTNSGAQGDYTGLLIIRAWHEAQGQAPAVTSEDARQTRNVSPGATNDSGASTPRRDLCIIPDSAHGTNPASAAMAGFSVVVVPSTKAGEMDLDALSEILAEKGPRVAAMMVTYPSTFGIFDPAVPRAIEMVHEAGGQVYLDGANMNAQVGLTSPGRIGADVCHLNLHKSFAIPHGGGGPGVGPVLTAAHLTPYLPGTPDNPGPTGVVVAAPAGSAGVFSVSYGYIAMLGARGLRASSERAILGANYIAARLASRVEIAYGGAPGNAAADQNSAARSKRQPPDTRRPLAVRRPRVAHECILDFRTVEKETGVTVEDIAKRLIDYGFHAPTMSWPVAGTLMVEPTESESKQEIDRFCDAMLSIMDEIDEIRSGTCTLEESPLRLAPHTAEDIAGHWERSYGREKGVYPAEWIRERKFWPPVNRVDNPYGDRNLFCTCEPLETWKEPAES